MKLASTNRPVSLPSVGRIEVLGSCALLALMFLYLVPVWSFDYFVTQDGAAHVDSAHVLVHLMLDDSRLIDEYYETDLEPIPNWTAQILMAGLQVFLAPNTAEKALVSIYVFLFAVALWLLLDSINPESKWMTVLGFPLIFSWPLSKGFYGFALGVAISMLILAWWLRARDGFYWRRVFLLSGALLVLYFTHASAFAVLVAVLVTEAIGSELLHGICRSAPQPEHQSSSLVLKMAKNVGWIGIAAFPSLALLAWFVLSHPAGENGSSGIALKGWEITSLLNFTNTLTSFDPRERTLALLYAVLMISISVVGITRTVRSRAARGTNDFLVSLIVVVLLYLFVPNSLAGGSHAATRLSIFPAILLLCWLSTMNWSQRERKLIQSCAWLLAFLFLAVNIKTRQAIDGYVQEYLSIGPYLHKDSTLLTLCLSPDLPQHSNISFEPRVSPFLHLSGYLAASHDVVNLSNYQGWQTHFPVRWRRGANPFRGRTRSLGLLPIDSLLAADPELLSRAEFVLVWSTESKREYSNLLATLEGTHLLAARSIPRGFSQLYERRELPHE